MRLGNKLSEAYDSHIRLFHLFGIGTVPLGPDNQESTECSARNIHIYTYVHEYICVLVLLLGGTVVAIRISSLTQSCQVSHLRNNFLLLGLSGGVEVMNLRSCCMLLTRILLAKLAAFELAACLICLSQVRCCSLC